MKWLERFKKHKKQKKETQVPSERIDLSNNVDTSNHISGLYFMRTMSIVNGQEIYAVKIGKSSDVGKRMYMYRTHTPFAILGGMCEVKYSLLNAYEDACHIYLHRYAMPNIYCSGEWEIVNKENYEELCKMCDTNDGFAQFVGKALVA